MRLGVVGLCALMALVLVVGCGTDTKEDATTSASTYDKLWDSTFSRCGSCHGAGSSDTLGGPDLGSKSTFRDALVGKKGSDYPDWQTFQVNRESCLAISFIAASDSARSLVVAIFDSAVASALCEVKAHDQAPQSVTMSDSTLATLKQWIDEGAQP